MQRRNAPASWRDVRDHERALAAPDEGTGVGAEACAHATLATSKPMPSKAPKRKNVFFTMAASLTSGNCGAKLLIRIRSLQAHLL